MYHTLLLVCCCMLMKKKNDGKNGVKMVGMVTEKVAEVDWVLGPLQEISKQSACISEHKTRRDSGDPFVPTESHVSESGNEKH